MRDKLLKGILNTISERVSGEVIEYFIIQLSYRQSTRVLRLWTVSGIEV